MTINCTAKKWIQFISLPLALFLFLPIVACSSNSAEQRSAYDIDTEEEQLMDANSKFLIDNLPMISFKNEYLLGLVQDLKDEGAMDFVSAEAKSEIESESKIEPNAFIDIVIKDSLGNLFTVNISGDGYYTDFLVSRIDGEEYTIIIEPPMA